MQMKNKLVGNISMMLGVISLLSTIIFTTSSDVVTGEMACQKFWLSRMALVFTACSLFSLCINREQHLSFYSFVTWGLIILGGIEAIGGLRQIYGFAISNNSLYSLTGSFFNPGPYSGYLAMVFPICLYEWLNLKRITERTRLEQIRYYIVLCVIVLILCVLPAGMSRSAWIAAVVSGMWVYGVHASWGSRFKKFGQKYKIRIVLIFMMGVVLLIMVGCILFQLKAASANGRLFMWKITCLAIAEKPFVGYGSGNFSSIYGEAQERYFANGKYSETEELVAGSPEYAFNEYLQLAVEYGIPFLIAVLLVIVFCLWKGIMERRIGVCGGVISVLVFAFSSYPIQIPGFAITFYCLLVACVMGRSKIVLLFFTLIVILYGTYYWKNNQYGVCKQWHTYKILYNISAYQSVKKEYGKIYPKMRNKGIFLFEYGHSLHKLKEYDLSTKILKEAMKYSNDPMIMNIIGKNYHELGKYKKAEEWLIRSTHRLPGRIYPYYLLAKLYAEPKYNYPDKLRMAVEVVLTKKPKVQSAAVMEMRNEVKGMVEK